MAISVQNKKNRYVRGGHGPRVVRRTILDGLRPTARSIYVRWFDSTVGRRRRTPLPPTRSSTAIARTRRRMGRTRAGYSPGCHQRIK